MVITWGNIGDKRAKRIKWRLETVLQLLVHIFLDHLHRYMPGSLDHHLNIMFPGNFCQFTQGFQLAELRCIVGISQTAGTQAITK